MPGLWDCHVHFEGLGQTDDSAANYICFITEHPASAGA
jgi:hypothetical protein